MDIESVSAIPNMLASGHCHPNGEAEGENEKGAI
jgi:hypothetical protein